MRRLPSTERATDTKGKYSATHGVAREVSVENSGSPTVEKKRKVRATSNIGWLGEEMIEVQAK